MGLRHTLANVQVVEKRKQKAFRHLDIIIISQVIHLVMNMARGQVGQRQRQQHAPRREQKLVQEQDGIILFILVQGVQIVI